MLQLLVGIEQSWDGSRYDYVIYGVIELKHIANKEYVDDKMQELPTRIEELERLDLKTTGFNY